MSSVKSDDVERHPITALVALPGAPGQSVVGLRVEGIVRNEVAVAASSFPYLNFVSIQAAPSLSEDRTPFRSRVPVRLKAVGCQQISPQGGEASGNSKPVLLILAKVRNQRSASTDADG